VDENWSSVRWNLIYSNKGITEWAPRQEKERSPSKCIRLSFYMFGKPGMEMDIL